MTAAEPPSYTLASHTSVPHTSAARPALQLRSLSKSFSGQCALDRVSFGFNEGSFNLVLGANGSGKSTLLKLLAGLLRPTEGKVEYAGEKGIPLSRIGYQGHQLFLYSHLTVLENMSLYRDIFRAKIDLKGWLRSWGLHEFSGRRICDLSKGLQYRASLGRAMINEPDFLIMDEPSSSLDQTATDLLLRNISELKAKKERLTVIVATHDLSRLKQHADRVVVLDQGKSAFDSEEFALKNGVSAADAREEALSIYGSVNR